MRESESTGHDTKKNDVMASSSDRTMHSSHADGLRRTKHADDNKPSDESSTLGMYDLGIRSADNDIEF